LSGDCAICILHGEPSKDANRDLHNLFPENENNLAEFQFSSLERR